MLCIILTALLAFSPIELNKRVPITTDYASAEKLSKVFDKPMILLFTGSDWSVDSQKFLRDILVAPTFYDVLKRDFIFAQIDFPEIETHASKLVEKNCDLKKKFDVETFPMLILLDQNQHEISRTGIFSEDPEQFAAHLKSLLNRYQNILHTLENPQLSIDQLKFCYSDAKELGASDLIERVLDQGLKSETDPYFHLERLSALLTARAENSAEAKTLRMKILNLDPDNAFGARYRLAILDFQTLAEKGDLKPEEVISPMQSYIETFGKTDKDHLWRIHMMIAHYLYSKGQTKDALDHARTSYQAAPTFMKRDAYKSVEFFKSKL